MSTITQVTTSMRSARTRALLPRIAVYAVFAVLGIAGLRAIFADPTPPPVVTPAPPSDVTQQGFAEGFVRAYLSWDEEAADARQRELAAYLPASLDPAGGIEPPQGAKQDVEWTAVTGTVREGRRVTVSVVAQTSASGRIHLAVPVARDRRGFLYVADYPALVGPPPVQRNAETTKGNPVEDRALTTVVERALRNYLAGAPGNLRADLTEDAVVSLPAQRLRLIETGDVTWIRVGQSVEVEVKATDEAQASWTLHYDLQMYKSDRWYVRSIQNNPTYKERSQ